MITYSFTVPAKLPGLNEYTAACRSNAYSGAAMKKDTETMIRMFIRQQLGAVIRARKLPARYPVKVYFRWSEGGSRPRDKDNIAFAKKFLLDACVAEGVLMSDAWDYVDTFEDSFFRARQYSVTVDIAALTREKERGK